MKNLTRWIFVAVMGVHAGLVSQASLAGEDAQANAPAFPTHPVRWIVPYPPGGPTDLVARVVGDRLGERLHQPVLIENQAGASGNIGMEAAARAAPDGYTIVFGATSMVLNPLLVDPDFDPTKELTAVSQIASVTYVLIAGPSFRPHSVAELIAAAKAKPGGITCGCGATLFRLGCELLRLRGEIEITSVPYKGNALAMNDLIGGHIDLMFDPVSTALPQINAGRVRAIATTNPRRGVGPLGQLPTVSETLPGLELTGWFGVLAPAATPRAIVARLNREIASVLEDDDVRRHLADSGLEIVHGSPEAFSEVVRRDRDWYARIVRESGIKPE